MIAAIAFLVAARHLPHPAPSRAHHYGAIVRARPAISPVHMNEIGITGGTTEYDGMAHTYTISGHVRVTLQDMAVTCDKAVIQASADEERVVKIDFLGDVVAVRNHDTFRGDDVTYYVASKRLLARGDTVTRIRMPARGGPAVRPREVPR